MATDKNGRELKVGDEVLLRCSVSRIYNAFDPAVEMVRITVFDGSILYLHPSDVVLLESDAGEPAYAVDGDEPEPDYPGNDFPNPI